jgi:plasmid stabilization system protein ParE
MPSRPWAQSCLPVVFVAVPDTDDSMCAQIWHRQCVWGTHYVGAGVDLGLAGRRRLSPRAAAESAARSLSAWLQRACRSQVGRPKRGTARRRVRGGVECECTRRYPTHGGRLAPQLRSRRDVRGDVGGRSSSGPLIMPEFGHREASATTADVAGRADRPSHLEGNGECGES